MVIPIGMDYKWTVSGTAVKIVGCEQCHQEYVYEAQRSAVEGAFSPLFLDNTRTSERAYTKAQNALAKKLDIAIDLVPCPACGWYQSEMVAKARRLSYRWFKIIGLTMLGLVVVFSTGVGFANAETTILPAGPIIPWPLFCVVVGLLLALAVGLIAIKYAFAGHYDPNADDVEKRLSLAKSRALLRADYDKIVAEQQSKGLPDGRPKSNNRNTQ